MNWILEKVIKSGSGRILSFLKRGSVWELYEEPEIILTADFCNLNKSLIGPEREQDQIIVAVLITAAKWQNIFNVEMPIGRSFLNFFIWWFIFDFLEYFF